jgi:hypothetical protein
VSSINPLGRLFNASVSVTTANTRFSLRDASGILFLVTGATTGNATLQEANAPSGGTIQNLAVITEYWTQNNGVWTRSTQAAAATAPSVTGGLTAFYVPQGALSDGFSYLAVSHATGTIVPVMADLDVRRAPQNLRDVRA